jgi:hypothetical protein
MKTKFNLLFLLALVILGGLCSCGRTEDDDEPIVSGDNIVVTGSIKTNTTWQAKNKYLLQGFVYVDSGAVLTIEPGTVIKGDKASKASLVVKAYGKIIAEGTVGKPIVFTSNQPKGSRNPGDWGGLIILGNSIVNKTPATIEGENKATFGGTVANDNSGILKYVRIEFAGVAFETDKEINGLTLGGVGSGTTIDYVQVSSTGDDGFEWFGGNVNAKHLISYKNVDDDFDTDWGYSGNVQYALSYRDPNIADQCDCSDSNGFESDNDGAASAATPQTSCKFANVTIMLADGTPNVKFRSSFRLRRNSALSIYNCLAIGNFSKGGLELEGDPTKKNFTEGRSDFKGLILTGMAKPIVGGDEMLLKDAARKNIFGVDVTTLGLAAGYNSNSGKPGLIPAGSSLLLTAGVALPAGFIADSSVGAFSKTDWTEGWANWDPQNTDY